MSAIRWADGSSWSLFLWAGQRISTLFPKKARKGVHAAPDDFTPPFYTSMFCAPLKRRADFRKAAELALPQLMPLQPKDLLIYGRSRDEGIELAAFRRSDIQAWWKSSGARHPTRAIRISDTWSVLPPEATRLLAQRRLSCAVGAALAVIAAIVLYFTYVSSLDHRLSALLIEEQQARSAAVALARQRGEANLWDSLESSRASARLPAAVLASMAEFSRELAAGAVWTRVEWTPAKVTIAGTATDPVAVLAALSGIRGARAAFSRPVTGTSAGRQEYEILVTFGET